MSTTSRKFYDKIFILEQNSRNHESFLPLKFGAIRYVNETINNDYTSLHLVNRLFETNVRYPFIQLD